MTFKLFKLLFFLKGKSLHIFLCLVLIFAFCFKDSVPTALAMGISEEPDDSYTETYPEEEQASKALTVTEADINEITTNVIESVIFEANITESETASIETEAEETTVSETTAAEETTVTEAATTEAETTTEETTAEEITEAETEPEPETEPETEPELEPEPEAPPAVNSQYGQRYQEQWEIDYGNQLFDIVNSEREKYGVAPLKKMDELTAAAVERAWEVSINCSHTRPDGTSCFTILPEHGLALSTRAENIAYYSSTPEAAFNNLSSNFAHYDPMVNAKFEYMGIGFYHTNGNNYWVQIFYTP